ncbi:MAG TPA: CPBP family intramembrane metalloprotease [Anaerolineales bacterium]|nr:CPBP family intramembrane metalloprotease [Anaerolineales bacterium]
MLEKKNIYWFLGITVLLSWPLFLSTLFLGNMDAQTKQLTTQGLWAAAMWGPGIAAIITTLFIAKVPFNSLRLNTIGPKRFYLWAWFLPTVFTVLSGLFTILFGIGKLDLSFNMIRTALESTPGGSEIPASVVVLSQSLLALTLAPFLNMLFTMGEELGWRGFLLPRLLPLGQWKAVLWSGLIWGLWHAPVIVQGHNYPGYPILGVFMMIVFCFLLGTIIAWLYINTKSPWVAALAHGAVNAIAGLPVLFLAPGFNMAFGGTLAAPTAWIGMALFIAWLVWTKRFPVQEQTGDAQSTSEVDRSENTK